MKNLKNIPALLILLVIFVAVGCSKPNNPPAPIPDAPKITAYVPAGILPYADSANFSWTVTGEISSVTLDGKDVSPSGSHNTGRLLVDQDYTLRATGPGGSDSKTIAIKVGDWMTSMYGMISHGYWIFGSISEKSDLTHNLWYVFTKDETDPGFYTDSYYFYPKGLFELRNRYTNDLISSHRWDLSGDVISFEGGDSGIVTQATEDTLTIVAKSSFADSTGERHIAYIRNIYIRDN